MASSTRDTSRPVVGATRARQGRSGRHVLLVLGFGLLLVILGFTIAYLSNSDEMGRTAANNGPSDRAAVFNAPEPAPINSAVEGNNAPDNLAPAGGQQPNPSSPPAQ
ncbi:hypothetical protein LRS10_04680 [Phenylobacterium sp. J426]|uniref:hypothetical protein n=1 Tax=Phenylobacterium sp. J426 TaxID=2898439 RepID=UPI002151BB6A|nr:hypothetical protein [Phenylobacterium sp. J426]MCR5873540.1 hypothetical protein [Phenylobacterium sp. J426]